MRISIDLNKITGEIKRMNGTGQAPMGGGIGYNAYNNFFYLSDVCVPYVRLHDVGGPYGGNRYVDIPNIFRDFDADESDPENYDFAFTDAYISALIKNGLNPYYRLGVTIENHAEIKAYHIHPPKDYQKWARICEHIIAHYNEGWDDGFHYGIEYWEIWNESDDMDGISRMWQGTPESYYRFYDVAAKYLKERFPNIKIGGFASNGFVRQDLAQQKYFRDYFYGFIKYIKEHNSPIDFFSWHSYNDPQTLIGEAKWVRKQLNEYGYSNIESHLNEWNPPSRNTRDAGSKHAADVAATMLGCQNTDVDMLMIYDARYDATHYSAFFGHCPDGMTLTRAYYVFAAFSRLYKLKKQVKLECDTDGVYSVAASDGKRNALMISNISGKNHKLEISGVNLSDARWSVIDESRLLSWSVPLQEIKNNTVVLVEF